MRRVPRFVVLLLLAVACNGRTNGEGSSSASDDDGHEDEGEGGKKDVADDPDLPNDTGPACDDGLTDCDSDCVDLETDSAHCGSCDKACSTDAKTEVGYCHEGVCDPIWAPTCITDQDGFTSCADFCASVGEECRDETGYCFLGPLLWGEDELKECEELDHLTANVFGANSCADPLPFGEVAFDGDVLTYARCCCTQ